MQTPTLKIDAGPLFDINYTATDDIIVNQGGSRSGKTYSILQVLIVKACQQRGMTISIVRKTMVSLRGTAMRDFMDIMMKMGLWDDDAYLKGASQYILNGNRFEFMGLDDPQKKRGAKRDILFCNEANELTKEDFMQLELRTTKQIYIDFNPSDEYHWLYDDVIPRAKFIKSTYKDNPFLEQKVVQRIERLQETDPTSWMVYGLGERAQSKDTIYQFHELEVSENATFICAGMDFGFSNDPTALIEIWQDGDSLFFRELLYRTGMTNQDISNFLKNHGYDRRTPIYADSAEPKSIEEIYRSGWNIKPAPKGKDSVNAGIQLLKTFKLHATPDSHNVIKEFRNYKWERDKNGRNLNKPRHEYSHAMDALRYGVFTHFGKPNRGKYHLR